MHILHRFKDIGEREWCDFVIYTPKGLNVQRISFDS